MRWRRKSLRFGTAVVVAALLPVVVVLAMTLLPAVATALELVVVVGTTEVAEEMREEEVEALDGDSDAELSAATLTVAAVDVVFSPLNPPSLRTVGSTCFSSVRKCQTTYPITLRSTGQPHLPPFLRGTAHPPTTRIAQIQPRQKNLFFVRVLLFNQAELRDPRTSAVESVAPSR